MHALVRAGTGRDPGGLKTAVPFPDPSVSGAEWPTVWFSRSNSDTLPRRKTRWDDGRASPGKQKKEKAKGEPISRPP